MPRREILTYQELERICSILVEMGVEKIRVTGGEPLVRKGILYLLRRLRALPGLGELCLTTNGVMLEEMASELKGAGVDRINVSLDSLDEGVYEAITSRPYLSRVLKGIFRAMEVGFVPLKINVVVMKGENHREIPDFLELARDDAINVRFIEFMPFGARGEGFFPVNSMMEIVMDRYSLVPVGPGSGPARDYRIPGFRGWVSFISPVSHPFCYECNRLRITAGGELRPCLLSSRAVDLKGPLRRGVSREELEALIREAVRQKPQGHSLGKGHESLGAMVGIGG